MRVALLILLAVVAAKVLKNFIAKRPVDEQVSDSPLYWALGLQGISLTLVTWAVPLMVRISWCWYSASLLTLLSALLLSTESGPILQLRCHPRSGNFAQRSEPVTLLIISISAYRRRYLASAGATEQGEMQ